MLEWTYLGFERRSKRDKDQHRPLIDGRSVIAGKEEYEPNPAPALLEAGATLKQIAEASMACRACDLYKNATQTVFGEGPASAPLMLVGEQPGDQEDREGAPFVGPAGGVLDRALDEAGIDRELVYVTNMVKHFRWMPKGKRRIHKKPSAEQIKACRPWFLAELEMVDPKVVVCLGATAAQGLIGRTFRVTQHRGEFAEWPYAPKVTATIHPSSILRSPDDATRRLEMKRFIDDFKFIARALG